MTTISFKTYLDSEVARGVSQLAAEQERSESAIIAEAVRMRLAESSAAAIKAKEDGIKRQLSRMEARLDKVIWEGAQLKEMLLLFVRVWLEYNPELDPDHEESAAASAEARFERFVDAVSQSLNAGRYTGDLDARKHASSGQEADADAGAPV